MRAMISGRASASVRGKEVKAKNIEGTREPMDLDPGDEKAHVSQSRGFKHWLSRDDKENHVGRGMSVESSVSVTLTCNQSIPDIKSAAMFAGEIAEDIAHAAINEMDEYLFAFVEDSR